MTEVGPQGNRIVSDRRKKDNAISVVPHKAVAEVSKIGNL